MDQTTLVKSDALIEARVLDALDRARIPITSYEWTYVEHLQEWQLVIATSLFDKKGPLATYRAATDALEKTGIYKQVPMRRVVLTSPEEMKVIQRDQWEGFIHILRQGNGRPRDYSLVFTPIAGQGFAPIKRFTSLEELRSFLAEELHLSPNSYQSALDEMKSKGTGSIYPVTLTTRQIKKLGQK